MSELESSLATGDDSRRKIKATMRVSFSRREFQNREAEGNSVTSNGQSIALGKGAKLNTGLNLNLKKKGKGDVSITLGDGGEQASELASQFNDTLKALNQANNDTLNNVTTQTTDAQKSLSDQLSSALSALTDKFSSLATTQGTGGLSDVTNIYKWLAVGGIGIAALWVWHKKKL